MISLHLRQNPVGFHHFILITQVCRRIFFRSKYRIKYSGEEEESAYIKTPFDVIWNDPLSAVVLK